VARVGLGLHLGHDLRQGGDELRYLLSGQGRVRAVRKPEGDGGAADLGGDAARKGRDHLASGSISSMGYP